MLNEISQEWRYKYLRISLLNGLQKVCGKYRLLKYIYTWLSQIFVPEWADCSSPILPETSWNILVCGIWKSWAPGSPGWAAGGWCWLWIATVRRSKFKVWRRNKTWSSVAQCLRFTKHHALPCQYIYSEWPISNQIKINKSNCKTKYYIQDLGGQLE